MESIYLRAEDIGVRLEMANGLPIWEAHPLPRHQKAVEKIRGSIRPIESHPAPCGCYVLPDTYIAFSGNTLKRPDLSIFCEETSENDEAIRTLPEAVVEVVGPCYEAKDLEVGLMFYQKEGIKDIVIFDPRTLLVLHAAEGTTKRLTSPVRIELRCGCEITV